MQVFAIARVALATAFRDLLVLPVNEVSCNCMLALGVNASSFLYSFALHVCMHAISLLFYLLFGSLCFSC